MRVFDTKSSLSSDIESRCIDESNSPSLSESVEKNKVNTISNTLGVDEKRENRVLNKTRPLELREFTISLHTRAHALKLRESISKSVKSLKFQDLLFKKAVIAWYENVPFIKDNYQSAQNYFSDTLEKAIIKLEECGLLKSENENEPTYIYYSVLENKIEVWGDYDTIILELTDLHSELSKILFRKKGERLHNKIKFIKQGHVTNVSKSKHSRTKWAYFDIKSIPLKINGREFRTRVTERFSLFKSTLREKVRKVRTRDGLKSLLSIKKGQRSREEMANVYKREGEKRGQEDFKHHSACTAIR